MRHAWLLPDNKDGPWNECTCGFVANSKLQMDAHTRANRNYRRRKRKRAEVQIQKNRR